MTWLIKIFLNICGILLNIPRDLKVYFFSVRFYLITLNFGLLSPFYTVLLFKSVLGFYSRFFMRNFKTPWKHLIIFTNSSLNPILKSWTIFANFFRPVELESRCTTWRGIIAWYPLPPLYACRLYCIPSPWVLYYL